MVEELAMYGGNTTLIHMGLLLHLFLKYARVAYTYLFLQLPCSEFREEGSPHTTTSCKPRGNGRPAQHWPYPRPL